MPDQPIDTITERTFYLVVLGAGSWGGGKPFRTYKAGAHEIDAEMAETILAWKKRHPGASYLFVMDEPPELTNGALGPLSLEDLLAGDQSGVRFKSPPTKPPPPQPAPDEPQPTPTEFACPRCERGFPSSARLNRHIKHQHVLHHEKNEARVRAQLEAAAAQRATERRLEDAARDPDRELDNLHPAEREAFDS
jgi:hypothetical protein